MPEQALAKKEKQLQELQDEAKELKPVQDAIFNLSRLIPNNQNFYAEILSSLNKAYPRMIPNNKNVYAEILSSPNKVYPNWLSADYFFPHQII